jgi:hypothetical protein
MAQSSLSERAYRDLESIANYIGNENSNHVLQEKPTSKASDRSVRPTLTPPAPPAHHTTTLLDRSLVPLGRLCGPRCTGCDGSR